ncbi:lysozyme C-like isoform X1 [Bufo bufo]|uniref:lysozyme C-like isoform X1 n=1 Tax=Bufo bufo TaxID=8384 RepID=UPI001ABE068D|nr:lysozyme C-like isoform X1 [Bufo bufo]
MKWQIHILGGLLFLLAIASGKKYDKCELAKVLKNGGLGGYKGYSLENWICTAFHESGFNTAATNYNRPDKSTDYGIFQINSRWWCNDYKTPRSKNACNVDCKVLLGDDISQAIKCAKRVVSDPNGMAAWVAWRKHCKGKNLSKWTQGCKL